MEQVDAVLRPTPAHDIKKRIRFTPKEIESLTALVADELQTLECREYDGVSLKLKRQAWQNVTEKFNRKPGYTKRTSSQLQKAWENLKFKKKHENFEKSKLTGHTMTEVTMHNVVQDSVVNRTGIRPKPDWHSGSEYWLLTDGRLLPKINHRDFVEPPRNIFMDTIVTESRANIIPPRFIPVMPRQPDHVNFADWATIGALDEAPDHGLWPISSILEHISEDELQRLLDATREQTQISETEEKPPLPPVKQTEDVASLTDATCDADADATGDADGDADARRRHQCPVCRKYFTQASSLRVHGRIHTGEKPFQCEVCHKSFNQSGSLRLHKTVHSSDRPYNCDICKKSFSRVRSLRLHMKTHSGHKPYKCDQCTKAFSQHANLKVHQKLHDKKRPFTCDDCFKEFDKHESLVHHVRIHRNLKPFSCDICGKRFPTPQSLGSHGKVHQEKVFDEAAFEKKLEDEKEETVYKCEVCPKSYTNVGSWRAHRRSHSMKKNKTRKRRKRRGGKRQ